jgi:hypothetical protein
MSYDSPSAKHLQEAMKRVAERHPNDPDYAPIVEQPVQAMSIVINPRVLMGYVNRLVKAEVADSWKGGGDPADIPYIESELKDSRAELKAFLKSCPENKS